MQATRIVQLVTSSDPGVRKAAELQLEEEKRNQQRKFWPVQLVKDLLSGDQFQSRHTTLRAARVVLAEEEVDKRHQDLCQLLTQGDMARACE